MTPEAAGFPRLEPDERLDLRVVSVDGVHALRAELRTVEPGTQRLVVSWPTERLRLFPLKAGQVVVVEISRPGDALYRQETLLESATTEEPPRLTLRPTGEWHRVQRRQAPRQPVDMRPSRAVRMLSTGDHQPFTAVMSDLSPGGLRLSTSAELVVDDQLELAFGTPSGGAELRLRVIVVRVAERRAGEYEVGCEFVERSPSERAQIVQFIVTQQNAVNRTHA
jgi:c-di-GMP-binding flagellar brake protein YcgR